MSPVASFLWHIIRVSLAPDFGNDSGNPTRGRQESSAGWGYTTVRLQAPSAARAPGVRFSDFQIRPLIAIGTDEAPGEDGTHRQAEAVAAQQGSRMAVFGAFGVAKDGNPAKRAADGRPHPPAAHFQGHTCQKHGKASPHERNPVAQQAVNQCEESDHRQEALRQLQARGEQDEQHGGADSERVCHGCESNRSIGRTGTRGWSQA